MQWKAKKNIIKFNSFFCICLKKNKKKPANKRRIICFNVFHFGWNVLANANQRMNRKKKHLMNWSHCCNSSQQGETVGEPYNLLLPIWLFFFVVICCVSAFS